MTRREPATTIDETAAVWAARVDRGLSPEEHAELAAWLNQDTRRVGAFARAQAIWVHAERMGSLGSSSPDLEPQRPAMLDRRVLMAGGLAAASLAAIAIVPQLTKRPREIATKIGQIERMTLDDGSVLTLDTGTTIKVSFSAGVRSIELLAGETFFVVAHDPKRPFVVSARDTIVRAIGTAFSVGLRLDHSVSVLVTEGRVAMTKIGKNTKHPAILLTANTGIAVPDASTPSPIAEGAIQTFQPDALTRALAWREGFLSFEGQPLLDAARRFNRYNAVHIVIDDPSLAREPITGLFAANDPKGFARAVCVSLAANVDIDGPTVRLWRNRTIK